MPCIHTSIYDSSVLAATCRQFRVPAPQEGCVQLEALGAVGWVVRLRELHYPIVCDTLTGLVAYHSRDNAFFPYRAIMRFVHGVYAMRHRLSRMPHHVNAYRRRSVVSAAG